MNANDIAEELESIHWLQDGGKSKPFQMYADFIRQQQAKIEFLQKKFDIALMMINDLENGLSSSINLNKAQAECKE